MNLVTVKELYKTPEAYLDKEITIGGWIRSLRDSKAFGFIVVSDGSYFEPLQVVYHDNLTNFAEINKLNVGTAVIVTGTLVATPQAKQPFEIQATGVVVEGTSAPDYPLQKKRHSFEYLRTISHLRPRTNTFQAVDVYKRQLIALVEVRLCVHLRHQLILFLRLVEAGPSVLKKRDLRGIHLLAEPGAEHVELVGIHAVILQGGVIVHLDVDGDAGRFYHIR